MPLRRDALPCHRLAHGASLCHCHACHLSIGGPSLAPVLQLDAASVHEAAPCKLAFAHPRSLPLEPPLTLTIPLIAPSNRKRRQPRFPAHGPALIGRRQLIGRIQRSQVHFDLVAGAREDARATAGAEEPPGMIARLALDRNRILRKDRGGIEERAMMLAAVEAVAKPHPVRASRRHDPHIAAQAAASESIHASSSLVADPIPPIIIPPGVTIHQVAAAPFGTQY